VFATIKEDLIEIEAAGFSINKDIGFISKTETEKIINKLKSLTSIGLSKKLNNRIHLDDMVKVIIIH
jgi:hypothetical protein